MQPPMQPPTDKEIDPSVQSDLTFSNLPVITVQAQDFGKDVESQQPYGMVEAVSSKPASVPKSNVIRIAGVMFLIAAIVGITVGVVVGTKGSSDDEKTASQTWNQPDSPRRSIMFTPSFGSCEALRTAFGELPGNAMNAVSNGPGEDAPIFVEPAFDWWPNYPEDYCESCNCSDGWRPYQYFAYDDMVMESAGAPEADGGSQEKQSADEYTGTNNQ
eukprot:1145407-Rhodomonas_salina.1